jgi:hypothetical protein
MKMTAREFVADIQDRLEKLETNAIIWLHHTLAVLAAAC